MLQLYQFQIKTSLQMYSRLHVMSALDRYLGCELLTLYTLYTIGHLDRVVVLVFNFLTVSRISE